MTSSSSIVPIHDRISIALCTAEEARILHRSRLRSMHFFTLERGLFSLIGPASLGDIFRFTQKLHATLRHQGKQVFNMPRFANLKSLFSRTRHRTVARHYQYFLFL
jgi:hypothetical protein